MMTKQHYSSKVTLSIVCKS